MQASRAYADDQSPRSAAHLLPPPGSGPRPAFLRPASLRSVQSTDTIGSYYHDGRKRSSIAGKYALPPDPRLWAELSAPEADDILHNPDPRRDQAYDRGGTIFSSRGCANLGCLALLAIGIIALFGGYPVTTYVLKKTGVTGNDSDPKSLNLGGTNMLGEKPTIPKNRGLIDPDTPDEAKTRSTFTPSKSSQFELVFSDEFNTEGRSFYEGDDPFWTAMNLNYWQTGDVEWYDPSAITTKDGALEITLSKKPQHDLNYTGGMMSTWNQFCFTGGIVEVAVTLPGSPDVSGLWPAIWTMGNLGRVGYGASTDGLWPYSYDSCDYGALPNQTLGNDPPGAFVPGMGDQYNGDKLSFLPGQRLSRCTCQGESHPGPVHSDGTYVGRAAPEIDIFEAAASPSGGNVSQSGQFAPFNYGYFFLNGTGTYDIWDSSVSTVNNYHGGAYQEAVSALSIANQQAYELSGNQYATYAIEYSPGFDDAYITWVNNNQAAFTVYSGALAADPNTEIAARPVSQEPMYVIMNLGMSSSFITIDYDNLVFPAKMRVDYVRVYQEADKYNVGCDPKDFPTAEYIDTYQEAYYNPNHTLWSDIGETFPKNSKLTQC
ncbi:unnamed protein product [Peniophora sp. CBMAI 1063]|nr:unnamed protein product [Peniophora sp. CBMAI 1063]